MHSGESVRCLWIAVLQGVHTFRLKVHLAHCEHLFHLVWSKLYCDSYIKVYEIAAVWREVVCLFVRLQYSSIMSMFAIVACIHGDLY